MAATLEMRKPKMARAVSVPAKSPGSEMRRLVLDLSVGDGSSESDINEAVRTFVNHLEDLFQTLGGRGLGIGEIQVDEVAAGGLVTLQVPVYALQADQADHLKGLGEMLGEMLKPDANYDHLPINEDPDLNLTEGQLDELLARRTGFADVYELLELRRRSL